MSQTNPHPESEMMRLGYDPHLASGSVKPPIYLTSTFAFKRVEDAEQYCQVINNLRPKREDEDFSNTYIYGRDTNPNLAVFEKRMAVWDGSEACAVFDSGMAAITAVFMAFLNPGDVIVFSEPCYGCTDFVLKHILTRFGIRPVGFRLRDGNAGLRAALAQPGVSEHLRMIYAETPSNPTNAMADIGECVALARKTSRPDRRTLVAIDNTFLGPLFQRPSDHGADLTLYSATKYIGGHSDLLAGVCAGPVELLNEVKLMRAMFGTTCSPHTAWMLTRSLETMKLRMEAQQAGARVVADYLARHPAVERVYYLGHLAAGDEQRAIFDRQCLGAGSMISIDLKGGKAAAFAFLNNLKLFHLAVSLGGNESLAEHPATMTHAEVDPEDRIEGGITDAMVRLSIGIEHPDDLIADLAQALAHCA
ncbi:MAG: aminotransferase class I/II-fold pyridoxal phosphate-dependent enzyme [Thermoflexales bacterium]|nr:aminotransferase class I/II-fold pyridoxal phosphate-dependent enzyme [Thermoflexales bacterium]